MSLFGKRNQMQVVYPIGVGVAVLLLVGFSLWYGKPQWVQNRPAPLSVVLQSTTGESVPLQSLFDGRPAVINTWASWCPYCAKEMPDLVSLQKEFPGVQVIAINRAESQEIAEEYVHTVDPEKVLTYVFDPADSWYRGIGGYVMPETVFISGDGSLVLHRRGALSLDEMRILTNKLLQKELTSLDAKSDAAGCTSLSCIDPLDSL